MTRDPMGDLSIKPTRDELAQRQGQRKPIRPGKSASQPPGSRPPAPMSASQSGLWSVLIVVIVCGVGGGIYLWGQIDAMQSRLESSLQSLSQAETALSNLQQSLENRDKTLSKSGDEIAADIKLLDAEVRKLWDLSNKRNKVNIANLDKKVTQLEAQVGGPKGKLATLETDLTVAKKELREVKESSDTLRNLVSSHQQELEKLRTLAENSGSFEDRITTVEVAIKAIDTHRRQINGRLDKLNKEVWELQKSTASSTPAPAP